MIKNIFSWIEEITFNKSPLSHFSEEDWSKWNSYMVHRFLSQNIEYIDIVNYIQKISPQNKEQIYTIYREMIPKRKKYPKYIKSETKKDYKKLPDYVSKYFECSLDESIEYISLLDKKIITEMLWNMGVNEKESKEILKGISL